MLEVAQNTLQPNKKFLLEVFNEIASEVALIKNDCDLTYKVISSIHMHKMRWAWYIYPSYLKMRFLTSHLDCEFATFFNRKISMENDYTCDFSQSERCNFLQSGH